MCLAIALNYKILYDMIRYAIVTCNQKMTWVRLMYSTEPTTKKWRTEKLKTICSQVSVNSPENPWSQSGRKKGRLWSEGFVEKGFKTGMKEWKDEGWWNWWVDGTDRRSATRRTGWVRTGEISAWLTEGSRELIPETRGSILKINPHKRRHSRWKLNQKL